MQSCLKCMVSLAKWLSVRLQTKWLRVQSSCSHLNVDIMPVLSENFLDIQATLKCRFTLKRVRDMIRTNS